MDDDKRVRRVYENLSSHLGYSAVVVAEGEAALAEYQEARSTGKPFDAVIMDLTVPGAIGGKEAAKRLLALDPEAVAIIPSGYSNDPVMADYRRHGFRDVIAKPFTSERLSEVLWKALKAKKRRARRVAPIAEPEFLATYYSRSGNTRRMAELVQEGLRSEGGVAVSVRSVEKTAAEELTNFDAIVAGSPTYCGTMAWPLKKLLDESMAFHGTLEGRVGAAFSSSGGLAGGNETTVLDILETFLIHGMVVQGDPDGDHYGAVAVCAPDDRAAESCRNLGRRVASLVKRRV
jgi:NAD(P)H dehydrogenase (quinone)